MRISHRETEDLINAITPFIKSFRAELRLYGSRVHDHLKGGDIDLLLLVDDEDTADILKLQKHSLLAEIKKLLGDRKIDVMIASREEIPTHVFLDMILQESVSIHLWL